MLHKFLEKINQNTSHSEDITPEHFHNIQEELNILSDKSLSSLAKVSQSLKNIFYKIYNDVIYKNLYERLLKEYKHAIASLQKRRDEQALPLHMHPLEEQQWIISFIHENVSSIASKELYQVILNHEFREKYVDFFDNSGDVSLFEIFLQNYLIPALSPDQVTAIFELIMQNASPEKEDYLAKFLHVLHFKQGRILVNFILENRRWEEKKKYTSIELLLRYMRNPQIEWIVPLLPMHIKKLAFSKLYPHTVIDCIEKESNTAQRDVLIQMVLAEYRKWWPTLSTTDSNDIIALKTKLQ